MYFFYSIDRFYKNSIFCLCCALFDAFLRAREAMNCKCLPNWFGFFLLRRFFLLLYFIPFCSLLSHSECLYVYIGVKNIILVKLQQMSLVYFYWDVGVMLLFTSFSSLTITISFKSTYIHFFIFSGVFLVFRFWCSFRRFTRCSLYFFFFFPFGVRFKDCVCVWMTWHVNVCMCLSVCFFGDIQWFCNLYTYHAREMNCKRDRT